MHRIITIHPRGPSAPSLIANAALKPLAVTSSATNSEFPSNLVLTVVILKTNIYSSKRKFLLMKFLASNIFEQQELRHIINRQV